MLICLALVVGLLLYIKFTKESNRHFGITFFNVGQGDAVLIQFADGQKMLVDCGIDKSVLNRLGEALPFYDRTLDFLLVTHPDADHYGGCAGVLKRYEVKNIITNGEEKPNDPYWPVWQKYVQAEKAINKNITQAEDWDIAGTKLEFLSPDQSLILAGKDGEGNNKSIVFRLLNDNQSFLLVGDAETLLENALLNKYCVSTSTPLVCSRLKADVLKVGHHGSDSSSGELFLSAVAPSKAVISVGKNKFGHPSFRVLKKLQREGAEVWRTDESGDISLP